MMLPSVFGENLFDDVFDDFWGFPSFDDKAMRKAERKLYGRHAAKMMKTDVQEHDDHYEVDIDLPGFKKDEITLELKDGYLVTVSYTHLDVYKRQSLPPMALFDISLGILYAISLKHSSSSGLKCPHSPFRIISNAALWVYFLP